MPPLEVELTCPLGSECETVSNGKIKRCVWYTKLSGRCPNTGVQVDDWNCAMHWLPLLTVEMTSTNTGQTAAIESLRNETKEGQDEFNKILKSASSGGTTPARGIQDTDVLLGETE